MRVLVASDLEWTVERHGDGQRPEDWPAGLGQQATDQEDQPAEWADKEKSFTNVWKDWQSESSQYPRRFLSGIRANRVRRQLRKTPSEPPGGSRLSSARSRTAGCVPEFLGLGFLCLGIGPQRRFGPFDATGSCWLP